MVITRYSPSDLISVVWFYFHGIKVKKRVRVQGKLLNQSWKTKEYFLQKPVTEKLKSWLTILHKEIRKNSQDINERSSCVRLEKLFRGLGNKPLSGLLVYQRIIPSVERLSSKFRSCPRSFPFRPNVNFLDNLSA